MHLYLIVLYNQNVFYSSTWISLVKLLESHPHTAKVYIWDNSPSAQHCKGDFDDLNGFEEVVYQHSQNNENFRLSIIALLIRHFKNVLNVSPYLIKIVYYL